MDQPEKIGRYKILGKHGTGGMGVVYRAEDPLIGRIVAIKMIQFEKTDEVDTPVVTSLKARFKKEAQAAGKLSHPNVVTIYDVGEEEGFAYIAMEFVDGKGLGEVLQSAKAREIDYVVQLFVQICKGLDYAHKQDIVHRDIKPSNILVTEEGIPKILDFGIAYHPSSDTTKTGIILGTPNYMSPEQVLGNQVTNRSDIFSLGIILYEFLTGERPFAADTTTVVMYKVAHEPFIPPSYKNPRIPKGFDAIIARALDKEPQARYGTCKAFAEDLENYARLQESDPDGMRTVVEEGMTTVVDDEGAGTPGPPPPPHPGRSTAGETGSRGDFSQERRRQHDRPSPPDRRSRWWIAPLLLVLAAGLVAAGALYGPEPWREKATEILAGTGWFPALERIELEVTFTSEPKGATVLLDGKALPGKTPLKRTFQEKPGQRHQVTFTLDRHREERRELTLEEGMDGTVTAELVEEIREIRITTTPKKSTIVVEEAGGVELQPSSPGVYTIRNDTEYLVKVSRSGYFTWGPKKVRGADFKGKNHYALDQERQIIIRQGERWAKTCTVSGAGVETTYDHPESITVGEGEYTLKVVNPDIFLDKTYPVDLRQKQSVPILPPPVRSISISAVPSACTIFVDGRNLGEPPITDLAIVEGDHQFEFHWRSGERVTKTERVTSQEDQRFFEARPEPGEGGDE